MQEKTPRSVIYFLAGSLPATALLHLRQLSLFGMITRLEHDVLNIHANNIFSYQTISKSSWFHQIRRYCLLYSLPHPSELLHVPLQKSDFKRLIKKKVISYWEIQLRGEAAVLPSLCFFHPAFMSLITCHPLWTTAGSSPYKVAMATVQASMLSGRYRTELLMKHWSSSKSGQCLLSHVCSGIPEDITHILKICPSLHQTRLGLADFTRKYVHDLPPAIVNVIMTFSDTKNPQFCDFILDCTSLAPVISIVQSYGDIALNYFFDITRTWAFVIHRDRLKQLDRWRDAR